MEVAAAFGPEEDIVRRAPTTNATSRTGARGVSLLAVLLVAGSTASALDAPHQPGGIVDCLFCHITHTALGPAQTSQATNAYLCQQCHQPLGNASDTSFTADAATEEPWTRGTSHAWGVSAVNGTLGTTSPLEPKMTVRMNGTTFVCSTCHDQHNSNDAVPGDAFPFLRISNAGGAMCVECHDPLKPLETPGPGRHMDGLDLSLTPPANLPLEADGTVSCTTCHALHFATSGPSQNVTATIGSITTSFEVSGTPWSANEFQGDRIFFTSGANAGRSRLIANNTDSAITWVDPLLDAIGGGQAPANADTASIQAAGAGDGKLLRQALTGDALCNECHNVLVHNKTNTGSARAEWGDTFTCLTCHKPHGTNNIFLVSDTITVAAGDGAPFSGSFGVDFRYMTTGVEDYGLAELPEPGDTPPGTGSNGLSAGTGVCEGCHTDTSVFNNVASGGVGRNGTHDTGTCTGCHPHGEGFKPAAGGCLGCHAAVKGAIDGTNYRRQVVGTGGDFERLSGHVSNGLETEIVTADDCSVCHDQASHADNAPVDPGVVLKDPDGGSSFTYDGTGGSIEGFCVNCHDSDGATASATLPLQPFSDLQTPPTNIAATWTGSAHDTGLAAQACMACHGGADGTRPGLGYEQDAHGSAQANLLSATVAGEAVTDAEWTEEDACYKCHDAGGPSTADVETDFGYAKHHRVLDSEQAAVGGRAAECSTCHGALHDMPASPVRTTSNAASRAIMNAPKGYTGTAVVTTVTKEYELCLLCHSDNPGGGSPGDGGVDPISDKWTQFAGPVEIHYSTTGSSGPWTFVEYTSGVAGSYNWTLPNDTSTNCYIRVQEKGGAGVSDVSGASFEIAASAPAEITVTSPIGAEVWRFGGQSQNITWSSVDAGANVDIHYSTTGSGGGWTEVVSNTPDDGTHSWTIPDDASANCFIRVREAGGGGAEDVSENAFEILSPVGDWVIVTSAKGYETWYIDDTVNITWDTDQVSARLWLFYSPNNGTDWNQIVRLDDPTNGGTYSYSWTVPNDDADLPSANCLIRVEHNGGAIDDSNANFTIATALPSSYITVTSPNGGEVWGVGQARTITWDQAGILTTSHPVLNAGSNPYCNSTTMVAPWNDTAGEHNTMWCSDCHRTDNASGPHGFDTGSDATNRVWGGLTAVQLTPPTGGDWYTPLCVKCHKITSYCTGVTGSGWNNHDMGQHRVGGHSGDGTKGGCLSCHYGGDMTTVHGGNHVDWFMTGEQLDAGGGGITPTTCAAAGIGNCGGHGDKGY